MSLENRKKRPTILRTDVVLADKDVVLAFTLEQRGAKYTERFVVYMP